MIVWFILIWIWKFTAMNYIIYCAIVDVTFETSIVDWYYASAFFFFVCELFLSFCLFSAWSQFCTEIWPRNFGTWSTTATYSRRTSTQVCNNSFGQPSDLIWLLLLLFHRPITNFDILRLWNEKAKCDFEIEHSFCCLVRLELKFKI